jgi:hypothetical protein
VCDKGFNAVLAVQFSQGERRWRAEILRTAYRRYWDRSMRHRVDQTCRNLMSNDDQLVEEGRLRGCTQETGSSHVNLF